MVLKGSVATALLTLIFGLLLAPPAPSAQSIIARWSLDDGAAASAVQGIPPGQVIKAQPGAGHSAGALVFEDWSTRNYLKPDPGQATRVVIPHDAKLNPAYPFRVTAWIYPTADPVYLGGIIEKGHGFGASYRLVLLRGLKVEACLGDRHVCARSAAALSLNAWHEVALVADTRTLSLKIDGEVAGQAPLDPAPRLLSSEPIIIGERFTGRIDEVSIEAL